MYIFLNDSYIKSDKPAIFPNDRGLLLGDSLFETIWFDGNKLVFLEQHIYRLEQSMKELLFPAQNKLYDIENICYNLLEKNNLHKNEASIRITVTRGHTTRGINIDKTCKPTLMVNTREFNRSCIQNFQACIFTDFPKNEYSPIIKHKTGNYMENILAKNHAQSKGYDEAILTNTKGNITETTVGNIFFIHNGTLLTPKISDGLLPGITRAQIIKTCNKNNIQILEKSIHKNEVHKFTEAFCSNSLVGIQPISIINSCSLTSNNETSLTSQVLSLFIMLEKNIFI